MNLVVNAKDAMPNGGKLTIETANVELDETYAQTRVAVVPGSYVRLAVSDNGCGMDAETKLRVFEPFFTTKERGKGTGLGLSTAYGIVKQSGGYVWVYSEPRHGTTFKVYLPKVQAQPSTKPEAQPVDPAPRGRETVLLVEDEEMVRTLVRQVLTWHGYHVLEARTGEEALKIIERNDQLDLLLTDVIMPGMSAIELVKIVESKRPDLKVIYMSGYTDHAIVRNGLLAGNVPFLQKPFAPDRLAHKVREVLNSRR
jgi:CheY-like chemotaxis protein